jgi:hypothetical protein
VNSTKHQRSFEKKIQLSMRKNRKFGKLQLVGEQELQHLSETHSRQNNPKPQHKKTLKKEMKVKEQAQEEKQREKLTLTDMCTSKKDFQDAQMYGSTYNLEQVIVLEGTDVNVKNTYQTYVPILEQMISMSANDWIFPDLIGYCGNDYATLVFGTEFFKLSFFDWLVDVSRGAREILAMFAEIAIFCITFHSVDLFVPNFTSDSIRIRHNIPQERKFLLPRSNAPNNQEFFFTNFGVFPISLLFCDFRDVKLQSTKDTWSHFLSDLKFRLNDDDNKVEVKNDVIDDICSVSANWSPAEFLQKIFKVEKIEKIDDQTYFAWVWIDKGTEKGRLNLDEDFIQFLGKSQF